MKASVRLALIQPWRHRALIMALVQRDLAGRYRGSLLGLLWPVLTPVLMLAVYTLVFGVVFKARWPQADQAGGLGQFALMLMAGLLVHGLLAETLVKAPTTIVNQPNYVKKVVFPLETLAWVDLLVALVHMAAGLTLLVVVNGFWGAVFAWAQLALPVILLPYAVLLLGLSWTLAAFGVYLRDLGQAVAPLTTVAMFLAPVFYARQTLPEPLASWLVINPVTVVVEQTRDAVFAGLWPDWGLWAGYAGAALLVHVLGLSLFVMLKRGFADVV